MKMRAIIILSYLAFLISLAAFGYAVFVKFSGHAPYVQANFESSK